MWPGRLKSCGLACAPVEVTRRNIRRKRAQKGSKSGEGGGGKVKACKIVPVLNIRRIERGKNTKTSLYHGMIKVRLCSFHVAFPSFPTASECTSKDTKTCLYQGIYDTSNDCAHSKLCVPPFPPLANVPEEGVHAHAQQCCVAFRLISRGVPPPPLIFTGKP